MSNKVIVKAVYKFAPKTAREECPLDYVTGQDVTQEVKDSFEQYRVMSLANDILFDGCLKLGGWIVLFNINSYVVKQYGQWREYYAPNKTLLRKAISGKIDKIVQVD